jgi:membrane protease subunit HflK
MRYLFAAALVLLAGYLLTGVTQVQPGERAVVRRFGRVLPEKPRPGLHVGLPWGMDRVDRVPVERVRGVTVGYRPGTEEGGPVAPPGQFLTGDHNLVNVQVVIHYAVRPEDEEIENYVVQADQVDGLVARAAESVLAAWVAERTVDDVRLGDKAQLQRRLVEETGRRIEPYRLGIVIQQASVADPGPPEQVKGAFDDVSRAQTAIKGMIDEAERRAHAQEESALAQKDEIEKQTAVYVADQHRQAKVDVDSFEKRLRQYELSGKEKPEYLRLLWWEEMGSFLTRLWASGRIDVLDHYLNGDGLDLSMFTPVRPKKR